MPEAEWPKDAWHAHPKQCWFTPQSAYLAHNWGFVEGITRFDERSAREDPGCNIVLKYERLAEDFSALMQAVGLRIRLSSHNSDSKMAGPGRVNATCFTPEGARSLLLPSVREIVQKWYATDLELFDYPP